MINDIAAGKFPLSSVESSRKRMELKFITESIKCQELTLRELYQKKSQIESALLFSSGIENEGEKDD